MANPNWKKGVSGNPAGRPKGSTDWRTEIKRKYIEPHIPELLAKAVEMANAGDQQMIRLLLDKTLPNLKASEIDLQSNGDGITINLGIKRKCGK